MATMWVQLEDGKLTPLEIKQYGKEKHLQELLAANPALLADALDGAGARWLLIDRELPIKPSEAEGGTWSLDHLFIGLDGRPILVEVKRSSDPRARREVVAQMLDYAASFAEDWPADFLKSRRTHRKGSTADVLSSELEDFIAASEFDTEEDWWSEVQTRINAGEIRLLFVADQISPTLRRIVEFLNDQLRTVDVLAVDVVQHASDLGGLIVFQPIIHGRSTPGGSKKAPSTRRSKDEFDAVVLEKSGDAVLEGIDALVAHVKALGGFESIGTGATSPVLYFNLRDPDGSVYWPLIINPRLKKLIVRIRKMHKHPAFEEPDTQAELLARIAAATGQPLMGGPGLDRWVPMDALAESAVVANVTEVLAWIKATADATD